LQIKNMVKNHHLAKSIQDSGWGMFFDILAYKAEEAGKQVVKVNPHNTSQICSGCGHIVKKTLAVRIHKCPHCGLELDRDINAARNILATALSITGLDGAFGDSLAVAG
jgi:putative transposase